MTTAPPAWHLASDRRIAAHRLGRFTLRLHAGDGSPLAHRQVRISQIRSRFKFGTCLSSAVLAEGADADRYRAFVLANFNAAVCENAMKWYATGKLPGPADYAEADRTQAWCEAHGLALRGHCLFWDKVKFTQPWVQALDGEALRAACDRRLGEIVPRWAGRLIAWDVNNEILDGGFYAPRLGDDVHAWMFRRAHELDPDTPLFVNEYGILDSDAKLERYCQLIDDLLARGAPLGGIGVQEHAAERFAPSPEDAAAEAGRPEREGRGPLIPDEVWRRLDRLAAYGLPIHLTEISSKTADATRRADTLEMLLRTAYAHPAVEAVLLWGFWSRSHWLGPDAALVDDRWHPLPAADRLAALNREWRTELDACTDADGALTFTGHRGDYRIAAGGGAAVDARLDRADVDVRVTFV